MNKYCNINEFQILTVKGEGAEVFLQGQLTCDVVALESGKATLGACCTAKGRMQANFWLWREEEGFGLLLPASAAEIALAHLGKYAVFSKVAITQDPTRAVLCLTGEVAECLESVISFAIPGQRALMIADQKALAAVTDSFTEDDMLWPEENFTQGIGFVTEKTSGLFTPQMINLEKLGGVSFTKGCYLGQEIIARTEHLGKLKRHLHKASVQTETRPQPGDVITNQKNEALGIVLSSVMHTEKMFNLLIVLQDRACDEAKLFVAQSEVTIQP